MNRYPTDQELNRLIEELEQEDMYFPAHLKQEILRQVPKESPQARGGGKRGQSFSVGIYALKIAAGMAAAIFLLFAWPVQEGGFRNTVETARREMDFSRPQERVSDRLREERENMADTIERWLEERKDGGKDNES